MKIGSLSKKLCLRCHLHRLDLHLIIGPEMTLHAHRDHLEDTKLDRPHLECHLHLLAHLLNSTQLPIGCPRNNEQVTISSMLLQVEAPQRALTS